MAIIYWSGTGNTEAMADAVLEGVQRAGADGAILVTEPVICNDCPNDTALEECRKLGEALA